MKYRFIEGRRVPEYFKEVSYVCPNCRLERKTREAVYREPGKSFYKRKVTKLVPCEDCIES